jgi:glycosyltransferase involved in cell wall biosynthesis
MRIALVADPTSPHTRAWVEALAAAGDEIALFSPHRLAPGSDLPATITAPLFRSRPLASEPARAETPPRAPADPHQLRTMTRALRLMPAFRRWLGETRPDLLLALRLQPEGYLAVMGGFRPWVLVSWGQDVLRFAHAHPFHRLWSGRAVRSADLLVGETDAVVAALRALGAPAERCRKGMTGIDVGYWRPPDEAVTPLATLRSAFPGDTLWIAALERGRPLILSPRAVAANGHQRELVTAVARLADTAPILVQVGTGDPFERAYCRDLARELGLTERYFDLGPVAREVLRAFCAQAAVVCSLWAPDGMSQTLLECMAVGGLPLAADLPGNREWIEHGVNGLLVDPRRPEVIAEALAAALQGRPPAAQARAMNRRRAVERAARADQMGRLIEALHALAGAGR